MRSIRQTRARSASKGVQEFSNRLFHALASATGSVVLLAVAVSTPARGEETSPPAIERDSYGAIVRGDVKAKKLAFIFTGDEFGESAAPVLDALKARRAKGSFFVTGKFLRDPKLKPVVRRMVAEGHYLGPHSDSHPLYCDWDSRDKSLVTEEFFTADLEKNLAALRAVGTMRPGTPAYFVAPYEWYNRDHVAWSRKSGVELINFTPGSGSNRDYMREDHSKFVSSRQIRDDILAYEQKDPHGLNGFLLLLHVGSGRKDPFHTEFGALCDVLTQRGYEFVRVDELLGELPKKD
jgi:peptidoglycan/xylan/chitin deacetylase (PgdA/CDA1 family)